MHLLIPARGVLAALLALSFIGAASAHSLWLERQGDGLRLYFGEFEENLREASPGLLDRLSPQAKVAVAGDKALKVDKTAGFFTVAGTVSADDSVVAEDVRIAERRTAEKVTRVLARLGARYVADFKERPPVNTLDVVPAGKPGAFKVFYQGKPLAKAKLELIAESGWKREFKTDEQGAVEAQLPWRGTYVIEVQHTDATPGKRGEEAYDSVRCASTLFVRVADGQQGPPQPALT
ncbi:MAG TPA: cobalt ABC transporter substrate-binding protein, partial [Reyranella sp.]|nr:cobalt ABC transporter substrate-binding protein [Reyranella sp.]